MHWTEVPCKEPNRAVNSSGYTNQHRLVFKNYYGFEPVVVNHLCKNRKCCEPLHLEASNNSKNHPNSEKDECPYGHPLDYDRPGTHKNGGRGRGCGACRKEQNKFQTEKSAKRPYTNRFTGRTTGY